MEQTDITKKFAALGLGTKDTETYLTLLRIGPSCVREISDDTGLNRSSLYVVLERLANSGLVTTAGPKGVRKYTASRPDKLEQIAKERLEEVQLARAALHTLVPDIERLVSHARNKPKVEIYPGTEGLQLYLEDTLKSREKVMRTFTDAARLSNALPGYLPKYIRNHLKQGIRIFGVHPDSQVAQAILEAFPNTKDEFTILSAETFRFPSDIAVYDNKAAFISYEPLVSVTIESRPVAGTMKRLFDLARLEATRRGKNSHKKYG